jgi:uncharacterized protein (DUF2267 family)
MTYDEFMGQVQNRARLGSTGDAVRATRATLEVLAQRLYGGEAEDLAAQLPHEIQPFLEKTGPSEDFGVDEFFRRVSEVESVDLPEAVYHARAVVSVLRDAVTPGEIEDMRAQLPGEYDPLFESGATGEMSRAA